MVVSLVSHHSRSHCNSPRDILQTKLVSFTPNTSGVTFSGPVLLNLSIPPACSHIPSLSATEPVSAAHNGFQQLQTPLSHWQPPSPAWSDPAVAARLQLLSCDWASSISQLLNCLDVASCGFLKQQLTVPQRLFPQVLVKPVTAFVKIMNAALCNLSPFHPLEILKQARLGNNKSSADIQ